MPVPSPLIGLTPDQAHRLQNLMRRRKNLTSEERTELEYLWAEHRDGWWNRLAWPGPAGVQLAEPLRASGRTQRRDRRSGIALFDTLVARSRRIGFVYRPITRVH
jgi:hypothetical protein